VIRPPKQDLKHKNVPQTNAMQWQCDRYKLVSDKTADLSLPPTDLFALEAIKFFVCT